jgi:uncharacterized protein (DUF488 family)
MSGIRPDTSDFRTLFEQAAVRHPGIGVTFVAIVGATVAFALILCAEAVGWRCHRRIVADHLLARRVPVAYILSAPRDPGRR